MAYMERTFEDRINPGRVLPGALSAICLLKNYYPHPSVYQRTGLAKVSRYAYGEDYHRVLKKRMFELVATLREEVVGAEFAYRVCVDSAPVMEKVWAKRAGLGWVGKHTNLIRKRAGSYFFIGVILTDLPSPGPQQLPTDHCGTCTRCIDACPTHALSPYAIDASRCISYLTIESKQDVPPEWEAHLEGWAFGCDVCQEVCPWNRFAAPAPVNDFPATPEVLEFTLADWQVLTNTQHKKRLAHTPLSRIARKKWLSNLEAAYRSKK
jgi:epoxyqueuosine reductase